MPHLWESWGIEVFQPKLVIFRVEPSIDASIRTYVPSKRVSSYLPDDISDDEVAGLMAYWILKVTPVSNTELTAALAWGIDKIGDTRLRKMIWILSSIAGAQ